MPILTNVTSFEDKVVDSVRSLQRPVVDTVRKGVERAEGRLPKLRVPALPRIDVPRPNLLLPDLPRPDLSKPVAVAESLAASLGESPVVRSQIDFAKALFDSQRDFAGDLADALSPLVASGAATPRRKKSAAVTNDIAETPPRNTSPKRKSTRS